MVRLKAYWLVRGWGWWGGGQGVGCAVHLVEIFHLVEIWSVYCLDLHSGLEFFN